MNAKYAARMTMIPQLDIPDIFVDDGVREDENARQGSAAQAAPSSHHLSVDGGHARQQSSGSRPESNTSQHPLSYPRPPGHRQCRHQASVLTFAKCQTRSQDPGRCDNKVMLSAQPRQGTCWTTQSGWKVFVEVKRPADLIGVRIATLI
jgi:hypothetical protein